jgi:trehalose-6-phosphate synthase
VDYTKGIIERFLAIERMLEKYPNYREKFTFVQIGAPRRTHIKRYHDLLADVEAESDRINWRFQSGKWKPIVFLKRHYSHQEISRYYRAADLCLVTSLHDGMNLVAKQFVAARHGEQRVLLLSRSLASPVNSSTLFSLTLTTLNGRQMLSATRWR